MMRAILVVSYFLVAWILVVVGTRLVRPLVISRYQMSRRRSVSERRVATLSRLVTDTFRVLVFAIAAILSLSLYVDSTGLLTFLGLFSAAFGLGARPLVSDYISGMIFLFEDQYAIGEKVEICGIEGIVEDVNLRTTYLRAPSGELFIIPNGDIRNIRNFARGTFSLGTVEVLVKTSQLDEASQVLNQVVERAAQEIVDLIEPPQIVSEDGVMGTHTRFTIVAKARYGHGAAVRRQLLIMLQEALTAAGVETEG
jgi:small conductance mechanosensitive channel